jgi:hypothetical protein
MDENDAALDYKNVAIVGAIKSLISQAIVQKPFALFL